MVQHAVMRGQGECIEFERCIPILAETDVLVCGGGVAGIAASVSAARNGVRTLLLERHGILGGTATSGLCPTFIIMDPRF